MDKIGVKIDLSTLKHSKSNGMCKRMMENLVKLTHAEITEGKEPNSHLNLFLREYRNTVNSLLVVCRLSCSLVVTQRL